ncbi:MAG: hypothetical protein KUG79_13995 [Pseudomonadales bacterium]|nr:hypothetical protein [Pseudomonadales bacterium]
MTTPEVWKLKSDASYILIIFVYLLLVIRATILLSLTQINPQALKHLINPLTRINDQIIPLNKQAIILGRRAPTWLISAVLTSAGIARLIVMPWLMEFPSQRGALEAHR